MTTKLKNSESSNRKARTRTLIQLGGIVSLSGLTSLLGVQEGDDLQLDIDYKDKAATLLGGLSELVLLLESSPELKEQWLQKGINILKIRQYQKYI